jgi:hypothetical protein
VVGLAAFAIFSLQDSVLIALGRATWLPVENGLFALAKVAVLPIALVAFGKSGHGVLVAWVIPLFATVAIINWLLVRRVLPRLERPAPERGRGVGRGSGLAAFVSLDLIGTILGQLSGAAIPLIVVASLGASENAYFFLPYTLVTTLDLVFLGLSTAVTAEASRDESPLPGGVTAPGGYSDRRVRSAGSQGVRSGLCPARGDLDPATGSSERFPIPVVGFPEHGPGPAAGMGIAGRRGNDGGAPGRADDRRLQACRRGWDRAGVAGRPRRDGGAGAPLAGAHAPTVSCSRS